MQFSDLKLSKSIGKALMENKHHTATLVQQRVIPIVLENRDVVVTAQTGSGKTAAFALPILEELLATQDAEKGGKKVTVLVLSPTRELAIQIKESFKKYGSYTNVRAMAIYGGVSDASQKEQLAKGVDILVATPGRFIDLHKQGVIDLTFLKTLVLDEADLMLDMGFINDVKQIEKLCPRKKQTLLFSATMPDRISELSKSILHKPELVTISPSETVSKNIGQLLYYVPKKNKTDLCLHLLRNTINGRIIIFRRTKYGVDKLENTLHKNGYKVVSLHGDKSQSLRNAAIETFKNNKASILIATDVAARGIDIPKIDAVINFDIPNIAETYVHRIGRTGRAGKSGIAFSLCSSDESSYVKDIQDLMERKITIEEEHPFPLHKPKPKKQPNTISKHKKGRKSSNSKKNKKRWY